MTNKYLYWDKETQKKWLQQLMKHFHPVQYSKESIEKTMETAFEQFPSSSEEDKRIILRFLSKDVYNLWEEEGLHAVFIDGYENDRDVQGIQKQHALNDITFGISHHQSKFLQTYITSWMATARLTHKPRVQLFVEISLYLQKTNHWNLQTIRNVLADTISLHQTGNFDEPLHFPVFLQKSELFETLFQNPWFTYAKEKEHMLYIFTHYDFFFDVLSQKDTDFIVCSLSNLLDIMLENDEKRKKQIQKHVEYIIQQKNETV